MVSEDDESQEGLLHEKTDTWAEESTKQQFRHSRAVLLPWILSAFLFCTTVRFAWQFYTSPIAQPSSGGKFETGFSTDFGTLLYSPFPYSFSFNYISCY
jgi:hypothetical protein